jgi:hypothetical protein
MVWTVDRKEPRRAWRPDVGKSNMP